jgi:hypothetical protein
LGHERFISILKAPLVPGPSVPSSLLWEEYKKEDGKAGIEDMPWY